MISATISATISAIITTPVGSLELIGTADAITAIDFAGSKPATPVPPDTAIETAALQLDQYFRGERTSFDLPLAPNGTPFQQKVWTALTKIPYGRTVSYLELAEEIGAPRAVRAVGHANGRNPIPIVIPCHRVIGSNGTLTGYAGGLGMKRSLLDLESGTPPLTLPID